MADTKKSSPSLRPDTGTGRNSRDDSITSVNLTSPLLKARSSSKLRRLKSPQLKRLPSGHAKLLFSVDDDIDDEIEEDDDKKDVLAKVDWGYLEGYKDALKSVVLKQSQDTQEGYFDIQKDRGEELGSEPNVKRHIVSPDDSLKIFQHLDEDLVATNVVNTPLIDDEFVTSDNHEIDDSKSVRSLSSSQTIESLNLRERQDAINSTHPFGIKIWKPSLYKKKRSVATRAEEDIHDYSERRPSGIYWGVYVTNFLWSITLGLFLYIVCTACAIALFITTGFGIRRNSRAYIKLLFKLAKFWLFPFGKFVLLNKDENYIEEDEIYGSSINEFHRWRREEEGRLFFAPPRRFTNSNESRPLLKDHKGRALRDAYTFLHDLPNDNDNDNDNDNPQRNDSQVDDTIDDTPNIKTRFFGRGSWTWPRIIFYCIFYGIIQPIFYSVGMLCWLIVFTIPMCNITTLLCSHLKRHPLALHFEDEKHYYNHQRSEAEQRKRKNQLILLCTYRCCGLHYYKYTIDGTNVFFINLLVAVIFVIFDFFVLKGILGLEIFITDSGFLFLACLFSTIPLAFFIGQAVASISAQSSMGVGAFINAFFSTIVEIFLYCVALSQEKAKIVEGAMIGSVLAGVLLLPGLSMCSGALKRKTQRYNPRSAGVSSTMLLFGMVTMFAPSLFYQIYGSYEIKCKNIENPSGHEDTLIDYGKCRFIQPSFALDALYYNIIQPFALAVAVALLLAYFCGIYFTLKSHASLIWATTSDHHLHKKDDGGSLRSPSVVSLDFNVKRTLDTKKSVTSALPSPALEITKQRNIKLPSQSSVPQIMNSSIKPPVPFPSLDAPKKTPDVTPRKLTVKEDLEEVSGHDAPNWSRSKSSFILVSATILYAVIAEILVDVVDEVLKMYPLNPKFLGLTVFALVPNTTEFINAISFAIGGNVALSMEIGSAYALQVVLIQIPVLALYSVFTGYTNPLKIFPLVFPRWDIIATLISIYLFTYIYAEGKSNYFKGVILMLIYGVVLIGFYLNDLLEEFNDGYYRPPNGFVAF